MQPTATVKQPACSVGGNSICYTRKKRAIFLPSVFNSKIMSGYHYNAGGALVAPKEK